MIRPGDARAPTPTRGPATHARPTARDHALQHLDAYGRYARVLAAQLEVLEAADAGEPDLARFRTLADEREDLAREIEAVPRPLPETPEIDDVLAEIRARMDECRETDAAVVRRLGELRDRTGKALAELHSRRPGREVYLHGPAPTSGGRRIDVKF